MQEISMANVIRASHILVEKFTEAQQIIERLKKGDDFAKVAEEKSLDGSRRRGGDLGFFGRGVMVREFEQAAFALQVGQITEQPVKSQFGYHVIKRTA
jgi:parvulin-like peptidyl-prolyl isomerase